MSKVVIGAPTFMAVPGFFGSLKKHPSPRAALDRERCNNVCNVRVTMIIVMKNSPAKKGIYKKRKRDNPLAVLR